MPGLCAAIVSIAMPNISLAQDWGEESYDNASRPAVSQGGQTGSGPSTGWSFRGGIGFTDDPNAFLMNFELPYAFDQWVSAGPMMQVGLHNDNTIVAPTLNITVTVPDLPGKDFDRIHPYSFAGIGFAYLKDDDRQRNDNDTGFLINFGFGLEYQLTQSLFLGSQMMFNFLPKDTLGENFFYSWQIIGARVAF